jgi:aspartate aminotransferase-like enzyme
VTDREWILLNPGPANTSREVREALVTPDLCHREPEFFEVSRASSRRSGCRRVSRTTPLHDTMKRRGYIIYAGQGDIRKYAFRVSNMGTLTPIDMRGVVEAFAASLAELRGGAR